MVLEAANRVDAAITIEESADKMGLSSAKFVILFLLGLAFLVVIVRPDVWKVLVLPCDAHMTERIGNRIDDIHDGDKNVRFVINKSPDGLMRYMGFYHETIRSTN